MPMKSSTGNYIVHLNMPDREEQQILEMKYMSATELNDDYIYTVLGMKRGKFYRKRKSGILNFATALEMI